MNTQKIANTLKEKHYLLAIINFATILTIIILIPTHDIFILTFISFFGTVFLYIFESVFLTYIIKEKHKSIEELIDEAWKEYHSEKKAEDNT